MAWSIPTTLNPSYALNISCSSICFADVLLTTKQMCEVNAQALCCQSKTTMLQNNPRACNRNAFLLLRLASLQFKFQFKVINLALWSRVLHFDLARKSYSESIFHDTYIGDFESVLGWQNLVVQTDIETMSSLNRKHQGPIFRTRPAFPEEWFAIRS